MFEIGAERSVPDVASAACADAPAAARAETAATAEPAERSLDSNGIGFPPVVVAAGFCPTAVRVGRLWRCAIIFASRVRSKP